MELFKWTIPTHFSLFLPLSPLRALHSLHLCMCIDRRQQVPQEDHASLSPPTVLAHALLCGNSDSSGQLGSKIYLQNLIRWLSWSLLLGRRGPGGLGWGGGQTGGDRAIDSQQWERETLRVVGLKSMLNFASNETPGFQQKGIIQLQISFSIFFLNSWNSSL